MSIHLIQDSTLTGIANTIRSKTGESTQLSPEEMVNEITEKLFIPSGNINITNTDIIDVAPKATATVQDANLIAENIVKNVNILGIIGNYERTYKQWSLPLGGKVFYDDGDNGAIYKFYDVNGDEVNYDGTIASLANATQYAISGTPTKDRFYVFNNELVTPKQWG